MRSEISSRLLGQISARVAKVTPALAGLAKPQTKKRNWDVLSKTISPTGN
jgi:hypothetical protein